jgi:hypothetical protein
MVPITMPTIVQSTEKKFFGETFLRIGILHGTYVKALYGDISRFFEKQDRFG